MSPVKRALGFWPLVATILCCVSGGPFGLEPLVQSGVGMSVLLVLITPIVWSVPAALMTAELSSAIPAEGGYYVWVRRAMGPFWGFLCGWWSWVFTWVDVAIYPVLFATYVQKLLVLLGYGTPFADRPWIAWAIGMTMIVPLVWLNVRGTKLVGDSSMLFFAIIVAPFIVLILLGLPRLMSHPGSAIHPFLAPGKTRGEAFSSGLFVVMWNYLGWDMLTTVNGEVQEPKRNYPRALALAVPVVTAIYVLPILIGVVFVPDVSKWHEGAWTDVARSIGGVGLAIAVTSVGLVSAAGLFSSTLLAGSRIPFVIAEDNVLPARLTKLHPKFGTPWIAILISACFYSLFSFAKFKDLAEVDVIVYSAGLVLEFVALALLRFREPGLERPYRIPGGWLGIFIVCLLPAVILGAAINDQMHGENRELVKRFTLLALASGPVVWYASKAVAATTRRRADV
jgi:amino acid transporter